MPFNSYSVEASPSMSPTIFAVFALLGLGLVYVLVSVGHRGKNFPPGPPTYPIVGNIHQISKKGTHFQFTVWAKRYGGIYTLKLGTGTAAVITDPRLVKELLDKRSSSSSERPSSYVAQLISGGDHILLMKYGAQWRDTRKLLHGSFTEKLVETNHIHLQEAEARQMVRDYMQSPEDHMSHPKRYSNSIAMSLVWGVRTPTIQTRHMQRLYSLMEVWSKVMETGATPPVDIYPLLYYLPQSIFLNWVDRASHVRKEMNHLYSDFLSDIRSRRKDTGSRGTLMDKVLDSAESQKRMDGMSYSDHELWFLGGTVTEGGSDTTASSLTAFVQAMAANPDIQRKAQAEIDLVMGDGRSPCWSDYKSLPYVAQRVKETMRWRPILPLGFPHALSSDEWVDGMFLPKGTAIIVNTWGMHNDPAKFPQLEKFDPDHYKGVTTLAPELANGKWENRDHYGYGVGRRFCPGAHLAERNLFLAMAKLLWAFNIRPGKGVSLDTDAATGYWEGFLVCAKDFDAQFEVRGGEQRRQTILKEFDETRDEFAKYEAAGQERA